MTRMKTKTTVVATLAIFVAAMALVPVASAQGTTLTVQADSPSAAILPGGAPGKLNVEVSYDGTSAAQALSGAVQPTLQIRFQNSCQGDGILIVGSSSLIMQVAPEAGSTALHGEVSNSFDVLATPSAKGLEPIQCTSTASADNLGPAGADAPADAQGPWTALVDYLSILSVKVDGKVTQSGPQKETNFPITVTNFGNAQSRVIFSTIERPENDRWVVGLPDEIVLNAQHEADGKVDTVQYTVISAYKTGWNNDQGSFTVSMTPISTIGGSKEGQPITANMIVRVKGVFVPGFDAIAMLGAVVGSALIARRKL